MWERFVRFWRSIFGGMIDSMENPELILKQSMRDMRDKVPKINQNLAKMRGGLNLLENEYNDYVDQERKLTARIKAALEAGDEKLAGDYALRLKQIQDSKGRNFEQLGKAREAYSKATEFKQDYMREMEKKIKDAEMALREHEASKWKAEVAEVFQSFEVGDIDSTVDEMTYKLRQKTAMAEGKLDMAMETVDMKDIQMEKRAEEIEAQEMLKQFKLEWGMGDKTAAGATADKTVGPLSSQDVSSGGDAIKTVGPAETETPS